MNEASEKQPWAYRRYLLIRGPKHGLPRLLQASFASEQRLRHRDLAAFMEHPPTKQAPLLFYPGCYVYSLKTVRATRKVLDHIGTPYEILGGVSYCCGLPHTLQGRHAEARECATRLSAAIAVVNPEIIATSCLECLEALHHLKQETGATYDVLHVLEYIQQHRTRFPDAHSTTPLILHEPCRFSKFPSVKIAAEALITSLGTAPQFLPPDTPRCCRRWHHGDPANHTQRRTTVDATASAHARLVCPCLTCHEAFQETCPTAPLLDLVDLFAQSLQPKEMTP